MKKTWKKILCSLMLAPCMFWATACGDDPDDQNNLTVDLTVEQQQEAYTTLRTLASNTLNNNGAKEQSYTLQYVLDRGVYKDVSNAGLTEANRVIVDEARMLDLTDKTTRTIYGGYKTNNEGYYVNKLVYDGKYMMESSSDTYTEVVKYQDSQYNTYIDNNGEKVISRVTNDYSKNKIIFDKDVIADTEAESMVEFFDLVDSTDVYGDFKSALSAWVSRTVANGRVEDAFEVDLSDYITSSYAFALKDGVYTLAVDINIDATNSTLMWYGDGNFIGAGKIIIVYTTNGIQKVALDLDSTMVLEESPARLFGDIVNQDFSANDKVISTDMMNTTVVLDFTTGFESSVFNQNLIGYNGQGEGGAIVNRQSTITIRNDLDENIEIKVPCGENLMAVVESAVAPYLTETNYKIHKVYWDAYTGEEVDENDVVPSYDTLVYVVLIDKDYEYRPTEIEVVYVNHDELSGTMIFDLNDNLYNVFKAIYGATDEQLIGIYSDAELQNKLPTDTLVEEGMKVYVVFSDDWTF